MNKNTNRTGDINEMLVCSKLLEYGFEVMRNVACTGLIDIVVFSNKTKKTYLFDIKTCKPYTKEDGSIRYHTGYLTEHQEEVGIKICFFLDNKVYVKENTEIVEIIDYDVKS
jgi:hypothetical protein